MSRHTAVVEHQYIISIHELYTSMQLAIGYQILCHNFLKLTWSFHHFHQTPCRMLAQALQYWLVEWSHCDPQLRSCFYRSYSETVTAIWMIHFCIHIMVKTVVIICVAMCSPNWWYLGDFGNHSKLILGKSHETYCLPEICKTFFLHKLIKMV